MAETRRISTLIESQLPEFISSDYENFSKVVEKYYEQLELRGQPLDVIQNITKYRDIDFYEKSLLSQGTELSVAVSASDTTIELVDGSSFPVENGYIQINDEILFYKERSGNTLSQVSRGISGNTKLGDLYEESNFVTTLSVGHNSGVRVQNISNLFLYAIVKNFESDYLASFPEKYLNEKVDKRTLIKNISSFYRAKGTDRSIKFIFNTLVGNDTPEILKPKDFTLKTSTSDWITSYSLKVKVLEGNAVDLIGQEIIQDLDSFDSNAGFASAIVDNVFGAGIIDGEQLFEIALDISSINNTFKIASKTELTANFDNGLTIGDRVNVFSTEGFPSAGRFVIDGEEFEYNDKSVTQFLISNRESNIVYSAGQNVYSVSTVTSGNIKLLVLGVLYNLKSNAPSPYSEEGDRIQVSGAGFETRDPIITTNQNTIRWILSQENAQAANANIQSQIGNLPGDVAAIFADSNYYYICSSSFPTRPILLANSQQTLQDQKTMRLIRKNPQSITESYPTTQRDIGIFVDGTIAFSYRDFDQVKFGPINKFNIFERGGSYKDAPNILINNIPGRARSFLAGEVVDRIELLDQTNYSITPDITITSGRNGRASATVTFGRITSIQIIDSGEYYTTPPTVRIIDRLGKGRFAEYNTVLKDGKIVDFEKVDEGKFYSKGNVIVDIIPVGSGAQATSDIVTYTKDRYRNLESLLDSSNGYAFQNFNPTKGYGYGIIANPTDLRTELNDDGTNHSPILGFAYDGNPIYGPYGFENPLDSGSAVQRLSSAYYLKDNRLGGPNPSEFPLGTFIEDYEWRPSTQTGKLELDEYNGRFCATPEYPKGTYAYFITIDVNGDPAFPYILGSNYYSLPVDSNYNADLSQDDIPKYAKRLKTDGIPNNGGNTVLKINKTTSGSISELKVDSSPEFFKVGNRFIVNDTGTEGSGAAATVAEVTGKQITSLKSNDLDPDNTLAVSYIETTSPCYLFEGDIITQEGSNYTGRVIGNISNRSEFVLENVSGTYQTGQDLNSSSNIINIILATNGSFSSGGTLLLTDGDDDVIARGRILESVSNQNSIRVEVIVGEFIVPESATKNYFLQSTVLGDSVGVEVVTYTELSKNIEAFVVDNNYALVSTSEPHNIGVGSAVNMDLIPSEADTTTTYYVRKRFYQEITLRDPSFTTVMTDSGVGKSSILNGGQAYQSQTYEDVELIFFDQSKVRNDMGSVGDPDNARATIIVSDFNGTGYGSVSQVTITNKGRNYIQGDILSVSDASLNRLDSTVSTQRLALEVDHVGFSLINTELSLNTIQKLSENDFLQINNEILKVVSINSDTRVATVQRGQFDTVVTNHFNNTTVRLYNGIYRFQENSRPLGSGLNDPYVIDYDTTTQKVTLAYNYDATSPREVTNSSIFQDDSSPRKSINISSFTPGENNLEFSKDINFATYGKNTDIRIQKYYRYLFDTSHFSMTGVFLDFSASKTGSIFTEEKELSGIQPGNVGSFVAITLGFGPNITGLDQQRFPVNFDTYYYFIKASSDVSTDNAALKVIDDPLTGPKTVKFTTSTKFAYKLPDVPDYQGTGNITYTTSSPFAEGSITKTSIDNLGQGYKRTPIIEGCIVTDSNQPLLDVSWDSITQSIKGVNIVDGGKNYINPKAIVTNGDGVGSKFKVVSDQGRITRIDVLSEGSGYTFAPIVSVYEGSVSAFFKSETIGLPQDISIVSNGGSFHNDATIESTYRSNYAVIYKGNSKFFKGERVEQREGSTVIFSAIVSKKGWRTGSNILRLEKVTGVIDTSMNLTSTLDSSRSVEISDVLFTEFDSDVRTYYDNLGRYASDKGKIGSRYQKLTDSFYYQDYSYVIQSRTAIDVWRDLIKQTTHPAGFQLFGEVLIDSEQEASMPTEQTPTTSISYIELAPKTVTVDRKSTVVQNSFVSVATSILRRGVGSISVDEYDTEGIIARELILAQPFTGRYATKEDFVGSIRAISKPGSDNEVAAAFVGTSNAVITDGSKFGHWIKFKLVSNSKNQPANGPQLPSGSSSQPWFAGSDNYTILPNDEYLTDGSGIFDLTKITRMTVGYLFDFGNFRSVDPTDLTDYNFGAYVESLESDFSQISYGFEVGDQITFYETAASYITLEIVEVKSPAYDEVEGVIGNGNILGRKTFTLLDKTNNLPYSPYNEQELFLTINAIAQEPGKSFRLSGSQITFSEPPLGPLYPQTGENLEDTYETDPAAFVCRSFKFKEDNLNSRYLKKLKDISPQFDGITNQFDLYWEDGTAIKADPGEKFLIFINGVLQEAKESSEAPLGNAYYILRRNGTQPDAIVFAEPPRNFADDIDPVPVQLDQRETFYGYGVGSYDRFRIDNNLIPYRGVGPYLVFGEVDGRVKNITDDRFILVFVDGVLQDTKTYILNGPNLTFLSPIKKYVPESGKSLQNRVRLISLYGRDVPKTLSFYDFDRCALTNEITVSVDRQITSAAGDAEYLEWQSRVNAFNPSKPKNLFTINSDGTNKLIGKISIIKFEELADGTTLGTPKVGVVATKIVMTVLNAQNFDFENLTYDPTQNVADDSRVSGLYVSVENDFSNAISFNVENKEYSVNLSYDVDDEGRRILVRDVPSWLRGSELGDDAYYGKYEQVLDIQPGDEILVDGENEYRKIEFIPSFANLRNFGKGQTAKYEHFTKVDVTNYNGIVRGEGLSVTTQIDGSGSVVSLGFSDLEWNKRDLALFFNTGILLQPTAYQYFVPPQIKFIPVDGNGGGARAEVIAVDGQILDVTLTKGGYGYTQPPRAVVTRGYVVKRDPQRTISTVSFLAIESDVAAGGALSVVQTEVLLTGEGTVSNIFSIIAIGGFVGDGIAADDQWTSIIQSAGDIVNPSGHKVGETLQVPPGGSQVFTKREAFGAFDQVASAIIVNETMITCTIDSIEVITDTQQDPETVSHQITTILQKQINTPVVYVKEDSYSATGTILDSPLSPVATIVYVPSTRLFPSAGSLQIGREIVSYKKTLDDRFYEVIRGVDGTEAQAHPAGQYLRTLPTFVTVLTASPATIVVTESAVRMTDAKLVELKSQIVIETEVKNAERYIEIENQFQIETFIDTTVVEAAVRSIRQPADQTVSINTERDILITNSVQVIDVVRTVSVDSLIENDLQILTPIVEPTVSVAIRSIFVPSESSVRHNPELESVVTVTVAPAVAYNRMPEDIKELMFTRDHQILVDPVDEFVVEKEIVVIPPTTVLDGTQSATSYSTVTEVVASISNISSDSARIESINRINQVGIERTITPGFKLETEITKFEGFKTETAFSTVVGSHESIARLSVTPVETQLGALHTSFVSTSIVDISELALVDFPRGKDGGILGGGSENGPRQIVSRINIFGDENINAVTVIETNIDMSVGGISSTYSVAPNLPEIDGRLKPADVTLQREMGVLDYFEEFVVLETTIKTRN